MDPSRTFELETHYLGGTETESDSEDEEIEYYSLTEKVPNSNFALQKFTRKPVTVFYNTKEVDDIFNVLLDLIHHGYIKV